VITDAIPLLAVSTRSLKNGTHAKLKTIKYTINGKKMDREKDALKMSIQTLLSSLPVSSYSGSEPLFISGTASISG
jgi:hypothetical protein